MSVVPIGYANATTAMYEENGEPVTGELASLSFPDPILPGVVSTYSIKSGSPVVSNQQAYDVDVTFILGIKTPTNGGVGTLRCVVGGIPFLDSTGQSNLGNGDPRLPVNPTQVRGSFASSSFVGTSVELNITGSCLISSINGLTVGLLWSPGTDTASIELTNIVYNYTGRGSARMRLG